MKIPEFKRYAELYRDVAEAAGVFARPDLLGGCLNTAHIKDDAEARRAVEEFGAALGAPATDPVRFGVDNLVDLLIR